MTKRKEHYAYLEKQQREIQDASQFRWVWLRNNLKAEIETDDPDE